MSSSWLLDWFCQYVQTKYQNPWSLTIDALGREYGTILLLEAATGQHALFATFIKVRFPFSEIRGLHYRNGPDDWAILYSANDETAEQLRTKLHETGEIVERRLSELWPDYRIAAFVRCLVEGDARYDKFANEALTSAFSLLINAARFLWETGVWAWRWLKEQLPPYAEGIRQFLADLGQEFILLVVLILLCLALCLIELTVSFLRRLLEQLWNVIKVILEFALVFLTRLFLMDREIHVLNYFGGEQCA